MGYCSWAIFVLLITHWGTFPSSKISPLNSGSIIPLASAYNNKERVSRYIDGMQNNDCIKIDILAILSL
ncbi:hypothetical protein XELAEV_18046440mg [Xenopus laevis]|uniref:Uncharacterized protein n=1 Tax=Xenopus laevis TaxID=8355 RepID=A0A974BT36_XENLA|nr:hypothetical protein XELAEV_18046440mg [Xenopus laevis]